MFLRSPWKLATIILPISPNASRKIMGVHPLILLKSTLLPDISEQVNQYCVFMNS